MTGHEKMADRIALISEAELRCLERGKLTMAWTWRQHRNELARRLDCMSVSEAKSEYMGNKPGIYRRTRHVQLVGTVKTAFTLIENLARKCESDALITR